MDVFRSFCERVRAEAGKSAKRSPARTRRHLLDCAQRLAVARPAGRIREMELGLSPVHPMEPGGTADILFEASAETEAIFRCASNDSIRPLCGRTTTQMAERGGWKNTLGRSCGGFSTKIHLRTNAEGLPIGTMITAGEAQDLKGP